MQLAEIAIRRFDDLQSRIPPELFPALRLIQRSPSPQGADFDPLPLIKAVNGLLPLGKEEALRALRTYVSLNPPGDYDLDPKRTFLIARLLFVRNDGDPRMPVMGIGGTDLPDTHDSPDWPLFPLALAKDVPFFLPWGYSLGGAGQAPTDHLDYCAANCVLRSQPLTPPVSPLAAAQSLFDSKEWGRLRSTGYGLFTEPTTENVRSHTQPRVRRQALRMLDNVLPGAANETKGSLSNPDKHWRDYVEELRRFPVAWDANADEFRRVNR